MEAALKFINEGDLEGKKVVVQGMGNVGKPLIRFLLEKNIRKIVAFDVNARRVEEIEKEFSNKKLEVRVAEPYDISIFKTDCDIFAPCSMGAVLNPMTIPLLKAKIVCGAANNQLEDTRRDDLALFKKKIVYVPDFLTNRMGIVHCANEQYGYVNNDLFIEQHLTKDSEYSIYQATLKVLDVSLKSIKPPAEVAIYLADKLSLEPHPIFGHRGKQIIASLIKDRWCEK